MIHRVSLWFSRKMSMTDIMTWLQLMSADVSSMRRGKRARTSIVYPVVFNSHDPSDSNLRKCSHVVESEAVSWSFPGMLLASSAMLKRKRFDPFAFNLPKFCVKESRHCQPPTGSPRRPSRNIHPCAYDAYGMTCVEAAACAVASAMGEGVGAKALLEDATLTLQMPKEVGGMELVLVPFLKFGTLG